MTNYNNQKKPRKVYMHPILLVAIIVAAVLFSVIATSAIFLVNDRGASIDKDMQKYERLEELYQYINENYIFEADTEGMINSAIDGLVYGSGDKYATYFTPEEYAEFVADDAGEYVGIGVAINIGDDGLISIAQVYRDSPANDVGILPGDKIVGVDGESVIGIDYMIVVDMVRGEVGDDIAITVDRNGEYIEYDMTRRVIISERAEWHMIDDEIGYIRLYEFSGNASVLFHEALNDLLDKGAKGFILDLRNNPGGDKNLVCQIADTLFPEGEIITLVDNEGNEYIDYSDKKYLNMPLAVLINENSASASELLAGGIQDYGVGTLIGTTTYGKGVAQGFYNFDDGAVLRLTTSKYLTAGGQFPQDVGITPDIEVELDEEILNNPSLIGTMDDNQLQAAIDVVRKEISGLAR